MLFFLTMLKLTLLVLAAIVLFKPDVNGDVWQNERRSLHGLQLRASTFDYPPCMSRMKMPSGNYSYFGICHDILTWMVSYYKMKLVYVPANATQIAKLGIVPALMEQLLNKEVDFVPYAFAPTPELWQQADFSIPVAIQYYSMLQRWPEETSRLTTLVRPFSLTVWIAFLFSSVVLIVFMALLTHFDRDLSTECNQTSFTDAISRHVNYVITVITGQGNSISPKEKFSLRLVAGLWCLTMMVMVNAYSSILTSYLAVHKLTPIVNTLQELAARISETEVTVHYGTEQTAMFLRATSGTHLILGNSLRKNPKLLVKGGHIFGGLQNVLELGATFITSRVVVDYLLALDMKSHPNCRLTSSPTIPYMDYSSAGLPKGSRYNAMMNYDFQYLWENGLLPYWLKKYTPNVDKCMVGKIKPSGRMTPFTLDDLSSAFALLGIGLTLSIFVFVLEMMMLLKLKWQKSHNAIAH
ncbi:hypothetical protein GHT06_016787 [Daphnia sinensis]|uniref:Ionotropic glutamate receptor C-terminal domain-containing protein n=1 Tax=Daphnia sinensis TaxID=1820382 RepID=A0AAD5PTB6_9CRUS|nr:hypothetical protein GHT06_016787 [Daphnia sinensis]